MQYGRAVIATAVVGVFCAHARPVRGAVVNGSFETLPDFVGWSTLGNNSVQGQSSYSPVPNQTVQAVTQSVGNGVANEAALDTFLSLPASYLNSQSASNSVFNGSAFKQRITGAGGDVVSFSANFLTNEASTGNPDFGFYTLANVGTGQVTFGKIGQATDALSNLSSVNQAKSGFNRENGYHLVSLTLPASGTFDLGFGVVNSGDGLGDSGLLVDNVAQAAGPAPLPAAVWAAPLAALAAGLVARRMRRWDQAFA